MDKLEKNILIGIFVVFSIFLLALLGFSALRLFIAIVIASIPFYFILSRFELETLEKIIFSFFLAIGIIPTFVYPLALLIGSVRTSTIIVAAALFGLAFLFRKK